MKAIIKGVNHAIQRPHPEESSAVKEERKRFELWLSKLIEENRIDLVAEEAARDDDVAGRMNAGDSEFFDSFDAFAAQDGLRWPRNRVEAEPSSAFRITTDRKCPYANIHPAFENSDDAEYEKGMVESVIANAGSAKTILVVCGERHVVSMERLLKTECWKIEPACYK
jgi:hypothetical protein